MNWPARCANAAQAAVCIVCAAPAMGQDAAAEWASIKSRSPIFGGPNAQKRAAAFRK